MVRTSRDGAGFDATAPSDGRAAGSSPRSAARIGGASWRRAFDVALVAFAFAMVAGAAFWQREPARITAADATRAAPFSLSTPNGQTPPAR